MRSEERSFSYPDSREDCDKLEDCSKCGRLADYLFEITFPEYPSPLTSLDLMFRDAMGMESPIRKAVPRDIPQIREFFDTLKLIEEGMAK